MKALCFYGVGDIRFEEVTQPVIEKKDDVIIKVKAVGICGSDISRYQKLGPYVEGNIWGHEFAGKIVEVGSEVNHVKVGQKVAGCPSIICYECEYCKLGRLAQCGNLSVIGAYEPGAFAEYIKLSVDSVVPIPEEVAYEEAAMVEPSSVVVHGYYKTKLQPGADVAVMGCGNIGLLAIQWAKLFGARNVFAIDIDDEKLEMAKEAGADIVINSLEGSPHEQLQKYINGVDVAIESAGTPITSAQVLALPKRGGEIVYLGIPYEDVPIDRFHFEHIVRNELSIHGSWNCISAPFPGKEWTTSIHYMKTGQLNVKPFITHRLKLSKGPKMFDQIINKKDTFGKVMLFPEWNE